MSSLPGYIPFHRPSIGNEEIEEVVNVLKSGWITSGPCTQRFEKEFAAYVKAPYALAVNSCTAGLHLALAALDVGPGDEVITTPMTFCSTVHTITHTGATPVLADIGADGNIDVNCIRERLTARTKAIMPVHLAGLPCDMDAIWALARERGLRVIEDAAHAVGTLYKGFQVGEGDPQTGARSDAVSFSFYATKNLTTGEGGMVTTHDPKLAERLRVLCLHGISKDAWNRYSDKGSWYYEVMETGFKYNLTDIQSALGIHQLRRQEEFIAIRRRYAAVYNEAFDGMEELEVPPGETTDSRHCWHLYVLRLVPERLDTSREDFIQELKNEGIGTSVHFIPVPLHPAFRAIAAEARNACPNAIALYRRIVSLPLYPAMSEDEVRLVARTVRRLAERNRKKVFLGAGEGVVAV